MNHRYITVGLNKITALYNNNVNRNAATLIIRLCVLLFSNMVRPTPTAMLKNWALPMIALIFQEKYTLQIQITIVMNF